MSCVANCLWIVDCWCIVNRVDSGPPLGVSTQDGWIVESEELQPLGGISAADSQQLPGAEIGVLMAKQGDF